MKTPEELNQNVLMYNYEESKKALEQIADTLLIVDEYLEKASKIGKAYSYIHLEHRNSKSKKIALHIAYDYLEKKGFRIDRQKNTIFWNKIESE